MNYEQSINYIHSIPKFCRPLGNANLEKLLTHLGNPQKKLKFIHIAGTNGKGSTAAMTAEILKKSGFKTGLFTSPYLEVFNERIRINGENITDNDLAEYVTRVKAIMEKNNALVSEFAFITAVSFLYFYEKQCDIKNFTKLVLSDPENTSHNKIVEDLFKSGAKDPLENEKLTQLAENSKLLKDLGLLD